MTHEEKAREIYEEILEFIIPHGEAEAFVERRVAQALREYGDARLEEACKLAEAKALNPGGINVYHLTREIRSLKSGGGDE